MIEISATTEGKNIPLDKRIIFALDVDSVDKAKDWVEKLKSQIKFYKVGLQLFLAGWFNIVDWIIDQGLEVMLDLKFFDVPQTVALSVEQLRCRGVTFATVHGNDAILKAAADKKGDVKILAVTVLTSLDEADMKSLGFECSAEDLVLSRARRALKLGCDGIVSSGLEAPKLRKELGGNFLIVVPGVRPVKNQEDIDDQKRIVDIDKAFLNGADHVVIGRPIRNAQDPIKETIRMQNQVEQALKHVRSLETA
ncbi:orotidine-5'-phosphate decarboxylase [bacterium]|nr:orotidine-5'-phosphate decarboxylase [bacterium]